MGLDLGTSVIKGLVMDAEGRVQCTAERPTEYVHPHSGWVEAEPERHRAVVTEVIRELVARSPGPVEALSAAAASGNTLLCAEDGAPLTNIINWMDQRAAQQRPHALRSLTVDEVRQITGWPCVDTFPLAHLSWLRENRSDLFAAAGRVCMNTDWLLFQLAGEWAMDHSTATTSHLQDQLSLSYHEPFLELLGIAERKLSSLVASGAPVGKVTASAAAATGLREGTTVVAGCFDHPGAARSVGVLRPGQLMLSCGTSWVGFLPEADRQRIIDAALLCDPFLSRRGGPWAGMFSVPRIGRTIDAYVRRIIAPGEADPYAVFNRAAATCAPGAGGLCIDLEEPVQELAASREQVSRAIMEGAAQLLADKLHALESQGFSFRDAVIVGGPSRSEVWSDIIGRTTGLNLSAGTAYSGAAGAAILAGIGTGLFSDEADAWKRTSRAR